MILRPEVPKDFVTTGRVESFLKDSTGRLPVSCTGITVKDSMEGRDGIEDSWLFTSYALRNGAGVAINLSDLRPRGTDNGRGLISSGPCAFAEIYSKLNEILRRGGTYKNGAVTLYLDYDHPDLEEFLEMTPEQLPWAKRAIYVDDDLIESPHYPTIIQRMKEGKLWLSKKRWDRHGRRLYSQVCMEIAFFSRSTCLLGHLNAGTVELENIPEAMESGTRFLCELHEQTGVGESDHYLKPEEDKQVGYGIVGLANLLARESISYKNFVASLEQILGCGHSEQRSTSKAWRLANKFLEGYDRAACIATKYGMERAFTIAPTASCSFRHRDNRGYTLTPEISVPNCHPKTKRVLRDSEAFNAIEYEYPPEVETAFDTEWSIQYRLIKAWQTLMNTTGLAHAISFDIWDKQEINHEFIVDWLRSPLWTTYYRRQVISQMTQDKSCVFNVVGGECLACAE